MFRDASVDRGAVAQLTILIFTHRPQSTVGPHEQRVIAARPARRDRSHAGRHLLPGVAVGRRAVAELAKNVRARGPQRSIRFHEQRVLAARRDRRHAGRHLLKGVAFGRSAIAQLAVIIPARAPQRSIRLYEQRAIDTRRNRRHSACHLFRGGPDSINTSRTVARCCAIAEFPISIVASPP